MYIYIYTYIYIYIYILFIYHIFYLKLIVDNRGAPKAPPTHYSLSLEKKWLHNVLRVP